MLPLPKFMGNKVTQTAAVSVCSKSQQALQYVASTKKPMTKGNNRVLY